ncbi:MAG: helix-turn-helix domain-containing protein [Cyclobacteriaceae bacterium]|nr:helix-turn-helix domain-containing protein [Cyclobacteriaceae bacterium]
MANPFELLGDQLNRIELLLTEIKTHHICQAVSLFASKQAKDNSIALAVQITGLKKKTIYNLVNKRLIPHAKRGKRLYFDEQELLQWIKEGKRKTHRELLSDLMQ